MFWRPSKDCFWECLFTFAIRNDLLWRIIKNNNKMLRRSKNKIYKVLSSVAPWGGCMVDSEGKCLKFRTADCLKMHFSGNFIVLWRFGISKIWFVKKNWLERYIETNKKHMKRLIFITQFKIEFLLPFTNCWKVFGKISCVLRAEIFLNFIELMPIPINIKIITNKYT